MPLVKSCSVDAFRKNIATEIDAGKSRDQAVAIALDTLREACGSEGKETPKVDGAEFVRVRRFDVGAISSVERLENGFLRCPGRITRTGVFTYRDAAGKTRNELRLPAEVFDAESLRSFALAPVTNDHPPENLDAKNTKKYQIGTIGEPTRDGEFVSTTVQITDSDAIDAVERGKRELSCGYVCDLEFTPGVTQGIDGVVDGLRYDAIQRLIRGNHVAIVSKGRAGAEASLRLDSFDAICEGDYKLTYCNLTKNQDTRSAIDGPNTFGGSQRMKITVDGITLDLDENACQIVTKAITRRDNEIETMQADAKAQAAAIVAEKARADKAVEDHATLQKTHNDATSPAKIAEAVKARVDLERAGLRVLGSKSDDGKDRTFDGVIDDEIRKAVIVKIAPASADKIAKADHLEIVTRFDMAIDMFDAKKDDKKKTNDGLDRARAAANNAGDHRNDSVDARKRMTVDNYNAGRRPIGVSAKSEVN